MEGAGWPRSVLLAFIRDKVEQSGVVPKEEKEAFAKVMHKMCTHDLLPRLSRLGRVLTANCFDWTSSRLKEWDHNVPLGMRTVQVRLDSVDWLFERGAFLVPTDYRTLRMMRQLARFPMWGKVKTVDDLERGIEGYWQLMADG